MKIRMKKISQLYESDIAEFGTKAIWLSRLINAGLHTPEGIVLSLSVNSSFRLTDSQTNELCSLLSFSPKVQYIVRSSAPGEDQQNSSCAGQFLSTGSCTGINEIISGIEQVYDQACKMYAKLGLKDPYFGIIVQTMIFGDTSGVCFTSDWQHPDQLSLEYISGSCEQLVQGTAHPGRRQFSHHVLRSRHQNASDSIELAARSFLVIADKFCQPLDIEWTMTGDKVTLLQARPVVSTESSESVSELQDREFSSLFQNSKKKDLLTTQSVGEVFGYPGPLFSGLIKEYVSTPDFLNQVFRRFGLTYTPQEPCFLTFFGRPWINVSAYARSLGLRIRFYTISKPYPRMLFSIRPWNLLTLLRLVKALFLIFRRKNSYIREQYNSESIDTQRSGQATRTSKGQVDLLKWSRTTNVLFTRLIPPHLEADILSGFLDAILQKIFFKILKNQGRVTTLISAFSSETMNPNLRYSLDLYELAHSRISWDEFILIHGHRSEADWNIASPRYRERKAYFQDLCEKLKNSPPPCSLEKKKRRNRLLHNIYQKQWWFRIFKGLLNQNGQLIYLREKTQNDLYFQIDQIRTLCLNRSTEIGLSADLVFFLKPEELFSTELNRNQLLSMAMKRQRVWRLAKTFSMAPFITPFKPDDFFSKSEIPMTDNHRKGLGVSYGTFQGTPFIAKNQEDLHRMPPGSVLIAKRIDPSWAPLLMSAGAIVTEMGGAFCHSSLLIREMGIPAVTGISGAPEIFRHKETLHVDGGKGIIQ